MVLGSTVLAILTILLFIGLMLLVFMVWYYLRQHRRHLSETAILVDTQSKVTNTRLSNIEWRIDENTKQAKTSIELLHELGRIMKHELGDNNRDRQ